MLTFAEEILLMMLDDDGALLPIRENTVQHVLTGAVLMDLAFANRIDTDPEQLIVIDRTPTGTPVLDRLLARIADDGETRNVREWIGTLAVSESASIREQALESLIKHGILEARDDKFLWVFRSRVYPVIDGRAEREVKQRIAGVLLSDEIPDPRDVALICLVDASGVLGEVFSEREIGRISDRIAQIRKMDLIGREVAGALTEIEQTMMVLMMGPH